MSDFMEGWKRITNDPYVLSIVTKGYGLRFTSSPLLHETLGNKISPGARGNSGHAGTNIPYASEERDNRGASEFPSILLKLVRKALGGWRPVHAVIDLKSLKAHIYALHFCMFTTSPQSHSCSNT